MPRGGQTGLLPSRATSAEVARVAGVSRATVSLVLNGRGKEIGISADTRKRVTDVAARLGYHPHHAARALRRRQSRIIALLLRYSIDNFYNAEVINAAQEIALARGYSLTIMSMQTEDAQRRALDLLAGGIADGVIVSAPPQDLLTDLLRLAGDGMPVVVIQHRSPDPAIHSVRVDLEQGGYLATRHLIDLGHRRIGHIGNQAQHLQRRRDRTDGYLKALQEAGLAVDEAIVVNDEASLRGGYNAMLKLTEDKATRPSAVFVYSDQMALGALKALRERGLAVPGDIAIVGFDGIVLADYSWPGLTTVEYSRADIGRDAIDAIIDQLEGGTATAREQVLPVRLRVRGSCGGTPDPD